MKAKDVATLRKMVERLREGRGFLNPDYGIILLDEIERLQALVKAGEKGTAAYVACPWCEMEGGGHFESCPAFTLDGVVK